MSTRNFFKAEASINYNDLPDNAKSFVDNPDSAELSIRIEIDRDKMYLLLNVTECLDTENEFQTGNFIYSGNLDCIEPEYINIINKVLNVSIPVFAEIQEKITFGDRVIRASVENGMRLNDERYLEFCMTYDDIWNLVVPNMPAEKLPYTEFDKMCDDLSCSLVIDKATMKISLNMIYIKDDKPVTKAEITINSTEKGMEMIKKILK